VTTKTGDGDDTVQVESIGGDTEILGGAGDDTVNVYDQVARSLSGIDAWLTFDGDAHFEEVITPVAYDPVLHDVVLDTAPYIYVDSAPDHTFIPTAGGSLLKAGILLVDADGGTFTLTFGGQTTGNISYSANASAIESALEALSSLNPADVSVSKAPEAAVYTISFSDTVSLNDIRQMSVDDSNLTDGLAGLTTTIIDYAQESKDRIVYVNKVGGQDQIWVRVADLDSAAGRIIEDKVQQRGYQELDQGFPVYYVLEPDGDVAQDDDLNRITTTAAQNNEKQTLTVEATGGTFRLGFEDQRTTPITFNPNLLQTRSDIESALETLLQSLPGIADGNVYVSPAVIVDGDTIFNITFMDDLTRTDVPQMNVYVGSLLGVAEVTTTVHGPVKVFTDLNNEIQVVRFDATSGQFTLTFDGHTTNAITFDSSNSSGTASAIQSALVVLPNIGSGDVAVSGDTSGEKYTVTFQGQFAHTDLPKIGIDDSSLTGTASVWSIPVDDGTGELLWMNQRGFASDREIVEYAFDSAGYATIPVFFSPPSVIKVNRIREVALTSNEVISQTFAGNDTLNIVSDDVSSNMTGVLDDYMRPVDTFDFAGRPVLHDVTVLYDQAVQNPSLTITADSVRDLNTNTDIYHTDGETVRYLGGEPIVGTDGYVVLDILGDPLLHQPGEAQFHLRREPDLNDLGQQVYHQADYNKLYFGDEQVQVGQPKVDRNNLVIIDPVEGDASQGNAVLYTAADLVDDFSNPVTHRKGERVYVWNGTDWVVDTYVGDGTEPKLYLGGEDKTYFGGEPAFHSAADPVQELHTFHRVDGLGMSGLIEFDALEDVNITLGAGDDIFTVESTHTGTTTVNAGSGGDTVDVKTIAGETTINADGGLDTVNIGDDNGLADQIAALLTVRGGSDFDTINVDDSSDATSNTGDLTDTHLDGLGTAAGVDYFTAEDLNVFLGTGSDIFTVLSTHSGMTDINASAGHDAINVRTIAGDTTINAGTGNDTINVGSQAGLSAAGTVNNISALLMVNGDDGQDVLNVDDSADPAYNAGQLTDTQLTGLGMSDGISYGTIETLNIDLGTGSDDFSVVDTHAGKTNLYSHAGDDDILIEAVSGVTDVLGGTGDDLITVDQVPSWASWMAGHEYTLNLDAQGGSDAYVVNVTGTGEYIINVLDTGAQNDGVDSLTVHGLDTIPASDDELGDTFLVRHNFVALLNDDFGDSAFDVVERINYDENINARLRIEGHGGHDSFFVDDNSSITTLDGGADNDYFHVGQMFGSRRDAAAGVAPGDEFDTIETTRGFLSNGISLPMVVYGGEGHDTFSVYHNKAVLRLEGESGNDTFIIRAFALVNPNGDPQAVTEVIGGEGDDFIQYNVNAPVGIDGGAGFDTVVVVGTEFADNFVIDENSIYGAGLHITFEGVESAEVDGVEGDDNFFVQSTRAGIVTTIIGGLGSDTFNIMGDVTGTIISNDLIGRSGVINHKVESQDPSYDHIGADGIDLNVADAEAHDQSVVIVESAGDTVVSEDGRLTDTYNILLPAPPPNPLKNVYLTVSAARSSSTDEEGGGDSILVSSDGDNFSRAVVLTFDASNWNMSQTIHVQAIQDSAEEGPRLVMISHSINSDDTTYDDLPIPNVEVTVMDDDIDGLIVEESGGSTDVLEDFISDSYTVALTRQPSDEVRVTLSHDGQLDLSVSELVFDTENWDQPQTVVVNALLDGVQENTSISSIVHSVDSGTSDFIVEDEPEVRVRVTDGDSPGVFIAETDGSTYVVENGAADTYQIVLTRMPAQDVIVQVVTDGQTAVSSTDGRFNGATNSITFLPTDWNSPVTLEVTAVLYSGPNTFEKKFPFRTHTLNKLEGPIIVEGFSPTGVSRSLAEAVILPTENDDIPLPEVTISTDESQQTDTMNVFNDGSMFTDTGELVNVLMNTTEVYGNLNGLGMADDLTVDMSEAQDGSQMATFLGGITYRDMEIVDILLGRGNDDFTVNGTTEAITAIHGGGGSDNITVNDRDGFLVVYGDTSENGIRYSATGGEASDHGVVFSNPGNDTIDVRTSQDSVMIYGGPADDVIWGSQAGDHIAGGSGDDQIHGQGGADHIYGDSGVNVDLTTHETTVPTSEVPGIDTIWGDDDDDIIFGDHGIITQTVGTVRIETTGNVERIETTNVFEGEVDTLYGGSGSDRITGGVAADTIEGNTGDDILIGDHGVIDYTADDDLATADLILSSHLDIGDGDTISGNAGADIVLGGTGGDTVYGDDAAATAADLDGSDVLIGDNGEITLVGAAFVQIRTTDDDEATGGADTIEGNADGDVILGGVGGDTLYGDATDSVASLDGDDVILGDNGTLTYSSGALTTIVSEPSFSLGGSDTISGNAGADIVLGGTSGDTMFGDDAAASADDLDGADTLLGDNGIVQLAPGATTPIEAIDVTEETGGADIIEGNYGDDIIIGGPNGSPDILAGNGGNDLILGDIGIIEVIGAGLILVTLDDTDVGNGDYITGLAGDDVILGGTGPDIIYGNEGDDTVLGDYGQMEFQSGSFKRAETLQRDHGDTDTIFGGTGEDVLVGGASSDTIDGDEGQDLIFGDNVRLNLREGAESTYSGRFQYLTDQTIYDEYDNPNVDNIQANPWLGTAPAWADWGINFLDHNKALNDSPTNAFGDDYLAGGSDDDMIFGQIGDDTIQGDGSIDETADADQGPTVHVLVADIGLDGQFDSVFFNVFEAVTDGDDYIEGNGGDDVIFGNLGQDDIIGGNSNLFSLNDPDNPENDRALRPDGSDIIFGGAGTDISRNNIGDETATGHARDADMILGDNGNIFRLVEVIDGDGSSTGYLTFNYDDPAFGYSDTLKIIPRAAELLDYTPGGLDYDDTASQAVNDIGAADEIHGESGDDFIYGMKGDDVLFGEGQDDDIIGGYDNDWISGGTGQDGVLGDDGRIYTSRNGFAEPIYGIGDLSGELDKYIYTPGKIQQATINVAGELKKTVNLTPFKLGDPDLFDYADQDPLFADDIIYGGLGGDFLHGGPGDDAVSGAEALPMYYDAPNNPGDVLKFGVYRAGEFGAYDEYDPLSKVYWDPATGEFVTGGSMEFLLNFDHTEGPAVAGIDWGTVNTDGDDQIFGDLGNDWLVGGTGKDHLYGGYGSDLLNVDDNHETNGGANDAPDTHPSYEDIAYAGAGRDVLIANTGGDRLIDWAGEFNSYIVPFAPFGMGTVSRTLQPQLMEYLYDLSASDGADPTRAADTGADPARNGEPEGELGLVKQKDFDWHGQTGAPDDPQPGNIAGGQRDVLRSASFNTGQMEGFFTDSGVFTVENGSLSVSAESLGGDAVSVFHVDEMLPQYFELQATINAVKPTAGWKSNAFVIFDYQNEYDFKFAGINVSLDKIQMGHRTTEGWIVDVQSGVKAKPGIDYNMLVAINGTNVTLVVDNNEFFSYTFAPRVDADGYVYGLNSGMVGLGSDNSRGTFDNMAVLVLPPEITFEGTEEFPETDNRISFELNSGQWKSDNGRYDGTPVNGDPAVSLVDLVGLDSGLQVASILGIKTTLNTSQTAGVVFDHYGADNFKFAAINAESDQLIIGHYTVKSGWVEDAVFNTSIDAGEDYELELSLKGSTVNASLKRADLDLPNYQAIVGYVFNAVTVDGDFGLFDRYGTGSFDEVTIKTDDPTFPLPEYLMATSLPTDPVSDESSLSYAELDPIIEEAITRWSESPLIDDEMLSELNNVSFIIADLSGAALGMTLDDTVYIDINAAGYDWFVDSTPEDDLEFTLQNEEGKLAADSSSAAYDDMDLLTVVMHELGHVLGLEDLDPDTHDLMSETLDAGVRQLADDQINADSVEVNEAEDLASLVVMDTAINEAEAIAPAPAKYGSSWLTDFLTNGAGKRYSKNPTPKGPALA